MASTSFRFTLFLAVVFFFSTSKTTTAQSSTTKSTTRTTTRGASITSSLSSIRAVSNQPHSDYYYYKPLGTGALVAIALGGIVAALGAVWIVRKYAGAIRNPATPVERPIIVRMSHTQGPIDVDPRPREGRLPREFEKPHPGSPSGKLTLPGPSNTSVPPDQPHPPTPPGPRGKDPLLKDDIYIHPPTRLPDMVRQEAKRPKNASSLPPDGASAESLYTDVSLELPDCHHCTPL